MSISEKHYFSTVNTGFDFNHIIQPFVQYSKLRLTPYSQNNTRN